MSVTDLFLRSKAKTSPADLWLHPESAEGGVPPSIFGHGTVMITLTPTGTGELVSPPSISDEGTVSVTLVATGIGEVVAAPEPEPVRVRGGRRRRRRREVEPVRPKAVLYTQHLKGRSLKVSAVPVVLRLLGGSESVSAVRVVGSVDLSVGLARAVEFSLDGSSSSTGRDELVVDGSSESLNHDRLLREDEELLLLL